MVGVLDDQIYRSAAEDLERLRDYGESGWEIDHVVAHGENQNAMLFVFSE